jgi:hypothetical protein
VHGRKNVIIQPIMSTHRGVANALQAQHGSLSQLPSKYKRKMVLRPANPQAVSRIRRGMLIHEYETSTWRGWLPLPEPALAYCCKHQVKSARLLNSKPAGASPDEVTALRVAHDTRAPFITTHAPPLTACDCLSSPSRRFSSLTRAPSPSPHHTP